MIQKEEIKEKVAEKKTSLVRREEESLFQLVETLIQKDLRPLAKSFIRLARFQERNQPVRPEAKPAANPTVPKGPFRNDREPALLVFVPRDLSGRIIDDLSGGYGYSHVCVDCGETDLDTGQPVMIESTTGAPVHRRFLDVYGDRCYARIPLKAMGVDPEPFCSCVASKVGEPYDYLEALTWGQVDDPARQVCSDLAADCLPDTLRLDFARAQYDGRLSRLAVSVHHRENGEIDVFVSPNAFCHYFGVPRGNDILYPNQTVSVHPIPVPHRGFWRRWAWVEGLLAGAALFGSLYWWISRRQKGLQQRKIT